MKFSITLKRSLFAATLAVMSFSSAAESPLISTMSAYLVEVDDTGNEVLKPAEKARPNQVIEYRLNYSNQGDSPIDGLAITGPIPDSTIYLADTAATMVRNNFKVSIDGGKTWDDEPVLRLRENQFNQMEQVVIPASEYTHVRWYAATPLVANAEQQYRYRVQIQ